MSAVRLSETQLAALPQLLASHGGNASAVARQLGVTRQAVQKRINNLGLIRKEPPPRKVVEVVTTTDPGSEEFKAARGLFARAAQIATDRDPNPLELVRIGEGLVRLGTALANAKKMALTYIDQRGGGVTVETVPVGVKDALMRGWAQEVEAGLCDVCRGTLRGGPGRVVEVEVIGSDTGGSSERVPSPENVSPEVTESQGGG